MEIFLFVSSNHNFFYWITFEIWIAITKICCCNTILLKHLGNFSDVLLFFQNSQKTFCVAVWIASYDFDLNEKSKEIIIQQLLVCKAGIEIFVHPENSEYGFDTHRSRFFLSSFHERASFYILWKNFQYWSVLIRNSSFLSRTKCIRLLDFTKINFWGFSLVEDLSRFPKLDFCRNFKTSLSLRGFVIGLSLPDMLKNNFN